MVTKLSRKDKILVTDGFLSLCNMFYCDMLIMSIGNSKNA